MPSNPILVSGQYLTGILASGIRPFRYRSGVHRLLGVPSRAETAVKFLPPLPPVGFQYERDQAFLGPPQSMPWSDGGTLFSQGVAEGETVSVRDTGNRGKETQPQVPATPASASSGSRSAKQGVSGVRTEGGDGRRASETVGQRSPGTQHTGLEIPGVTHRRSLFAALSAHGSPQEDAASAQRPLSQTASAKKDAQRAASVGEKTESSGMPPPAPGTKGGDPQRVLETSVDRSAETKHTGLEIPGITHRRPLYVALSRQRPTQENTASAERLGLQQTAVAKEQPRTVDSTVGGERPIAQRSPALTAYGASDPAETAGDVRQPARISTQPQRRADSITRGPAPALSSSVNEERPILFRSTQRAAEQVEHLRQAVTKLATRQATREAERREEPLASQAARPQPAPAQSVVVVQRAPRPIRQTPRAFWASSTLRSTHLRMLR